jgi:vitamin B12 transporter
MRHFIWGASLLALNAPAWGHDYAYETDDGDIIMGWCTADLVEESPDLCAHAAQRFEEIVSVGTRIGSENVVALTSPVSVIDGDLENRAQGSLSSVLRTVPGLSVSTSGGAAGLTHLRLRGAEANQIVVLIDGVEVANPTDGAFDFGGLRSDNIARVEVLRGEQSALYGSDAIGGVINIITKAGSSREGWRASVEAGSRETLEGSLNANISIGDASLSVLGNAFTTEGFNISGIENGEDDGAKSRSLTLGLNGVTLGNLGLSATYGFTRRDTDFDGDSDFDGRLNDTDGETTVETQTARVEGRLNIGEFQTLAALSRLETETDTRAGFSSNTTGSRTQATLAVERAFDDHNITVLGEWAQEEYEFEGDPDTPSNETYGVAGDYRFNTGNVTLTASARHDFNDLFDDATTWRLGAGYGFNWDGRVTASVGTGVKNPTLIELFGFFPASNFVGNADLQPENSLGYNIGYTQEIGEGSVSVNYFRSELEDEIVTIFNPDFSTGVANLTTDSTREGVEVEGRYRYGDLDLQASASFIDSDQNGVEEIRRPDFLASGTISWDATDNLTLSVFADHTGAQFDTDFATFSDVKLDAFTLVGANVDYAVSDVFSVYARGENLLDEDYEEVVGYRSPGRALYVGLRADY